jgi:hypothetical protein
MSRVRALADFGGVCAAAAVDSRTAEAVRESTITERNITSSIGLVCDERQETFSQKLLVAKDLRFLDRARKRVL